MPQFYPARFIRRSQNQPESKSERLALKDRTCIPRRRSLGVNHRRAGPERQERPSAHRAGPPLGAPRGSLLPALRSLAGQSGRRRTPPGIRSPPDLQGDVVERADMRAASVNVHSSMVRGAACGGRRDEAKFALRCRPLRWVPIRSSRDSDALRGCWRATRACRWRQHYGLVSIHDCQIGAFARTASAA